MGNTPSLHLYYASPVDTLRKIPKGVYVSPYPSVAYIHGMSHVDGSPWGEEDVEEYDGEDTIRFWPGRIPSLTPTLYTVEATRYQIVEDGSPEFCTTRVPLPIQAVPFDVAWDGDRAVVKVLGGSA